MKDIMLSGYLKDFSELHDFLDLDESQQFNHFVNYCVLSEYSSDDINLLEINVDGTHDIGIDGIVVLINGHCITSTDNVRYFAEKLNGIDVEFVFIQSKTSNKFKGHELGTFISGVKQFFNLDKDCPVNDEVRRYADLKDHIYDQYSIKMNKPPACCLIYASSGVWENDTSLKARINNDIKPLQDSEMFDSVKFVPYDSRKIKSIYKDLRKKIERVVVFDKRTTMPEFYGVTEAYTGIINVNEFFKLILTDDGNIIKSVFYDNVRDYQGDNPVNNEIAETLTSKEKRKRFPVLNNGVTIVARSIKKVGDNFGIHNYQIVNGCQTCNVLASKRCTFDDEFYIPLKIIVTEQQDVINEIIIATNRQTAVTTEAFESLSPFHQTLEDFYCHKNKSSKVQLHYERRSKQYLYDGISPHSIVSLASQTTNFVAMFLNQPQSTHRYYGELLDSNRSRIYKDNHSPYPYYISSYANSVVQKYFLRNEASISKDFRYHILMLIRIEIVGEEVPSFSNEKINSLCDKIEKTLDNEIETKKLIKKCCDTISSNSIDFSGDKRELYRSRAFTDSILVTKPSRPEGDVVYYNNDRAFGFIQSSISPYDVFFHISDVEEDSVSKIFKNAHVTFDIIEGDKGFIAKSVVAEKHVE